MIIHGVEQNSEEWFILRAGIPTASNASKLITGTGKRSAQVNDYALMLAAEMYAGKPLDAWEGSEWTERGLEMQSEALMAYEQSQGVWCDTVGFCTSDGGQYGCSPDGLVNEDGLVEIKCLAAKNHVKNMVYFNKHKKIMPDYMPQVQMQLLVCERKWCDLAFYSPDLPMLVVRQEVVPGIREELVKQILICLEIRDEALAIIKGEFNVR